MTVPLVAPSLKSSQSNALLRTGADFLTLIATLFAAAS
jgi:hypothetical protein